VIVADSGSTEVLANWRASVLSSILRVSVWLGLLAYFPSVYIALRSGMVLVVTVDTCVMALVVVLHRATGLPYQWRAALFSLCPFLIGVALLDGYGVYSQLFFIAFAVVTTLLLGQRAGLVAVLASTLLIALFGLMGLTGPQEMNVRPELLELWWAAMAINFTLVTTVLTLAVGLVLSTLEAALGEARSARDAAVRQGEVLRAFLDTVPDLVYSKDTEGRLRICNAAALAMQGVQHEHELTGRTVFDLYPREMAERLHADDLEVLAGRTVLNREVATRDVHGRPQWYLTMKVPFRNRDGAITGVIGISRNITDRKQLEEQLRQAQKMEAVGKLAGGIAHDFNNLLTIIIGFGELLRAETAAHPALAEPVDAISDAAERAASLTRQLLAFSRQTLLQPKVLDLNATITTTGRMLSRLIGENIRVSLALDPSISRVRVDPGQLDQVLMNLAVNARDAMPHGGTLTITTQELDLSEEVAARLESQAGRHVMIAVADTGIGMTPDVMVQIFDPFYTTKGVGNGTGLGLSMVFGIVRQSGGSISVDSEPGTGSTFRIFLPVASESTLPPDASAPTPSLRGSETVLLVEDDAGVRELARRTLAALGYDVLAAADGREALAIAASHGTDIALLVTDVMMPDMSGPEMVARLHATWPQLGVIYMSGYTSDAVVLQGVATSGISFLQKPYTPLRLTQMVRAVLDSAVTVPF
jgi:two-component system cell cycle sensor histidine kinase/response regulator CckA